MTSKQRAYLKSLAMTMDPVLQIGKFSMTPELTGAVQEALDARELIKINVLKNCADDPRAIAEMLAERTHSPSRTGYWQKDRALQRGVKNEKKKIELPR